jgi:hypothetical protein
MLHAGLDLSRKKLDVCLLSDRGEHLDQLAVPPDVDSLRRLAPCRCLQTSRRMPARNRSSTELAEPACAFEYGAYEITLVPRGGGEPLRDAGKYVTIYRRKDSGRWLMAYDIWNSNGPSPV